MRTIYAEPGEIKNAAAMVYDLQGEIKSVKQKLQSLKDDLPSYWGGEDAKIFLQKLDDCIVKITRYEKDAENYKEFLSKVADGFDAIEDAYGKSINVPTGG